MRRDAEVVLMDQYEREGLSTSPAAIAVREAISLIGESSALRCRVLPAAKLLAGMNL